MISYTSKDAWEPVCDELRASRHAAAMAEWSAVMASGDAHAAAMWLQERGYRLKDLKCAQLEWQTLLCNQGGLD